MRSIRLNEILQSTKQRRLKEVTQILFYST